MRNINTNEKEYSVIINLVIFFTIIIVVGATRLLITINENKQNTEEYLYLTEGDNTNKDTTEYNLKLIAALEKIYSFKIYYGDSSTKFAESVNAVNISDSEKVTSMLTNLAFALQKYPTDIIREMKEKGYSVSIYLVDHFTNSNVALANRNSNNEFRIYLSNNSSFERAMHHEVYHILEYYMGLEYGLDNIFVSWDDLNPKDFKYTEDINKITANYVYNKDPNNPSYFITLYSKYSAKEDRAEIFAESMMLKGKPDFYSRKAIKDKAELIYKNLDEYFKGAKENMPNFWERYL